MELSDCYDRNSEIIVGSPEAPLVDLAGNLYDSTPTFPVNKEVDYGRFADESVGDGGELMEFDQDEHQSRN